MRSVHKLIAIVVIWLAVAAMAWIVPSVAMVSFMDDDYVFFILVISLIAASAATWAVASARSGES